MPKWTARTAMAEPLKNMYNAAFMDDLGAAVKAEYSQFDDAAFINAVFDNTWDDLELKARMRHITTTLHALLPSDYPEAVQILRRASFRMSKYSFETMIFPDFVEVYGLDHWEDSIAAMEQFTQQSSAEFAVRPFIVKYDVQMMTQMHDWAKHENHHVRRLASEGCRPRLPWAMALPEFKKDPAPILPILETLKDDDSEYVRRSVANNWNDITKDNPRVALDNLRRWQQGASHDRLWIIRHALRGLIKAGNPDALDILGFKSPPQITVSDIKLSNTRIQFGETLQFEAEITSTTNTPQQLLVDYVIHHLKANGTRTPKVFKLTQKELAPSEALHISKSHALKPISTRKYYAGTHAIELKINGQDYGLTEFELVL